MYMCVCACVFLFSVSFSLINKINLFLGIVKESEKSGKSYAVYAVTVKKKMVGDDEVWDVYRRYSDFHDLHMIITDKVRFF